MSSPTTIKPLTSIRGLAALWVYLYHCSSMTSGSLFFNQFAADGYYGLDIFFILSGFIISYVHLDEFTTSADAKKNARRFLELRLSRIYPLHIVVLLVFVALQNNSAGVTDFLGHALLMQSWFPGSDNLIWNVPAWSISVEWLIYLCFPLFAWSIAGDAKDKAFNLGVLGTMLGLWTLYLAVSGQRIHDMVEPPVCLTRGILDFIIGVALYNIFRMKYLERLPWDAISVAALGGIFCISFARSRGIAVPDTAMILLFALLIYSLANIRSWGNYIFSNRAVVYLGTISYSIYMLHWLYLTGGAKFSEAVRPGAPFFHWHFVVQTLGLIALSAISYHVIENPARKWARKKVDK